MKRNHLKRAYIIIVRGMNRLHIINFINPSWYRQINEFLAEHPSFNKLIPIVALDEYPTGFNKNPHETDEDAPRNIFETIIYYLCAAKRARTANLSRDRRVL